MKSVYYPTDARIESFGLELAINNKDLDLMSFLWDDMKLAWDPKHFGYLLDYLLDFGWPLGLNWLLGSSTAHLLFESLNPEDKDQFLSRHVFSKKILPAKLEQILVQNLSEPPFSPFAYMKNPGFFNSPPETIEIEEIQAFNQV